MKFQTWRLGFDLDSVSSSISLQLLIWTQILWCKSYLWFYRIRKMGLTSQCLHDNLSGTLPKVLGQCQQTNRQNPTKSGRTNDRQSTGQLSANSWLTVGQQAVNCRPTVDKWLGAITSSWSGNEPALLPRRHERAAEMEPDQRPSIELSSDEQSTVNCR